MRSTAPAHITRRYLTGNCFDLALELAKVTKLPLWGLRLGGFGDIHHAFVADPETGMAFDIRGRMPIGSVADGSIPNLVPVPVTQADILDMIGGAPDPDLAKEARKDIRAYLPHLPKADARKEADILAQARRTTMARGEIASRLLGWSEDRLNAFRKEAATFQPDMRNLDAYLDEEPFGLTEEEAMSPGPERRMDGALRVAMGRYDAAKALRSWCRPDMPKFEQEAAAKLGEYYLDKFEADVMSADDVTQEIFPIDRFDDAYEGDPEGWIKGEHDRAIQDGRSGYADLLLEKISTPCVYRSYDDGTADIADGWHRTAAALSVGETAMMAVIVPLPAPEKDDCPFP